MRYKKLTIVGVGLIGGAVGIEVKNKNIAETVWGWGRKKKHLNIAIKKGACDRVTTNLKQAVNKSDFIVLATPPEIIKKQLAEIKPYMKKNTLVIDVGSVKQTIVETAQKYLASVPAEFVGCHPMAGSEKTGVKNTYSKMFEGAPCIVAKTEFNTRQAIFRIKNFWEKLGCKVIVAGPAEHDLMVAFVSHLPHIIASTLINSTYENIENEKKVKQMSGPSFRELTRFGAASEELWSQIYLENKPAVLKAIRVLKENLVKFEKILKKENVNKMKKLLKKARLKREEL